ncbi:MAG: hypothetical protein QW265_01590 [Candidatus Bathyarchaeia archaeon]
MGKIIISIIIMMIGLSFVTCGYLDLNDSTYDGPVNKLYVKKDLEIEPSLILWTWGVKANPKNPPIKWHLKIYFKANQTMIVRAFQDIDSKILYEKISSLIDEEVEFKLPEGEKWTWCVINPSENTGVIHNFTIEYYPVYKAPESSKGKTLIFIGGGMLLAGIVIMIKILLSSRSAHFL